jgi:transposase
MLQAFDASKSLTAFEQDSTVGQSNWLVSAVVPGIEGQFLKKIEANEEALLKLLHRWRPTLARLGS